VVGKKKYSQSIYVNDLDAIRKCGVVFLILFENNKSNLTEVFFYHRIEGAAQLSIRT
jgi:hypothetical protein